MQIKTGIDIIEVNRIKEAIQDLDEKFLKRVYTNYEIEYCNSKNNMKYQHFAARFAAKEAIIKALSDLLKNKYELDWKDIEIINSKDGKPKLILHREIKNIASIDISLSHLKEYAVANAMILVENDPS